MSPELTPDPVGPEPLSNTRVLSEDTSDLHDDLFQAIGHGTRAAELSAAHLSRLIYGPDVERHIAPYGVPPVPGSLDAQQGS